jgi:DNA end-binding protein Ku
MNDVLVVCKIRFAQEIRSTEELNLPAASKTKPSELKMAIALINQYTEPFQIEKYKDEYSEALLKVIKGKASGKKGKVRKLKVTDTKTQSLMEQLKASLSNKKIS